MSIPSIDIEAIRTARVITNAPIIAIAREYAAEIMEGSFDKVIYQPVHMSKLIDAIVEVTGTEMKIGGGNIDHKDLEVMRFDAKVLVAEDVPTNQMLIKLIMGESGIDVDIASNGLEAVEKYRTGSYDVVFMDIHMPVCNGINATKMIREHEQMTMRPLTPIIALTADAVKGEKERLLAEGMDDYITKPIDREALNAIFRKYIHVEAAGDVPEHSAGSRNAGFDIQGMAKSLGITEDTARFCLQDFFSSVDGDLEEFQANMNSRNRSGICEIAHKIKGTAANLRIDDIADICREVERIAKSGLTADDITVLNSKIERIAILKNNLREMVGRQ
jgi:CheY-like chemotaxis protein